MKYIVVLVLFLCQFFCNCQDLPLIYENNFEGSDLSEFAFSDANAWQHSEGALSLFGKSDYKPSVRSPFNIAVLKDLVVGDFVLEVDLKQTGKEYGHRDMCLFFGMNDPSNFYYVHIASVTDDHAHNIFIVNDEPRTKISTETTGGVDWGSGWNKIRVERNTAEGSILIYFNDMSKPIMKASDVHFLQGKIGFGSFDDTGMVDNIKVWGNKVEAKKSFF